MECQRLSAFSIAFLIGALSVIQFDWNTGKLYDDIYGWEYRPGRVAFIFTLGVPPAGNFIITAFLTMIIYRQVKMCFLVT